MDSTPASFGRDTCRECGEDINPLPYTLGTVTCDECGEENPVVT